MKELSLLQAQLMLIGTDSVDFPPMNQVLGVLGIYIIRSLARGGIVDSARARPISSSFFHKVKEPQGLFGNISLFLGTHSIHLLIYPLAVFSLSVEINITCTSASSGRADGGLAYKIPREVLPRPSLYPQSSDTKMIRDGLHTCL